MEGVMTPTVAYLAEGKLYMKRGDAGPKLIDSPFVQSMLDRHRAGADVEAPRIWALLVLELWLHEVVHGPAARPVALPVS